MPNWFKDKSQSICHTPMVRLNRNIDGAQRQGGLLGPGKELIEPTSGNTGIALAFVAAARSISLTLTMSDSEGRYLNCILFEGLINAKGLAV